MADRPAGDACAGLAVWPRGQPGGFLPPRNDRCGAVLRRQRHQVEGDAVRLPALVGRLRIPASLAHGRAPGRAAREAAGAGTHRGRAGRSRAECGDRRFPVPARRLHPDRGAARVRRGEEGVGFQASHRRGLSGSAAGGDGHRRGPAGPRRGCGPPGTGAFPFHAGASGVGRQRLCGRPGGLGPARPRHEGRGVPPRRRQSRLRGDPETLGCRAHVRLAGELPSPGA